KCNVSDPVDRDQRTHWWDKHRYTVCKYHTDRAQGGRARVQLRSESLPEKAKIPFADSECRCFCQSNPHPHTWLKRAPPEDPYRRSTGCEPGFASCHPAGSC